MEGLQQSDLGKVRTQALLRISDEVEQYEARLVRAGVVPDPQALPLRRHAVLIACLMTIPIALSVGLLAILINFILFNRVLHIGT